MQYQGMRIEPSPVAMRELLDLGLTLHDVARVLEEGFDCSASKRRAGVMERGLRVDGKMIRVVVEQRDFIYPDKFAEKLWYLIHVSIETFKKKRFG